MQPAGDGTITRACVKTEFKKTKTHATKAAINSREQHALCLEASAVPGMIAALRQLRRIVAFGFTSLM